MPRPKRQKAEGEEAVPPSETAAVLEGEEVSAGPTTKRLKTGEEAAADVNAPGEVDATADQANKEGGAGDDAGDAPSTAANANANNNKKPAAAKKRGPAAAKKVSYNAELMIQNFDHYLFQLLSFKADNGNFHVTKDEHAELHAWMQFLKQEYKNFSNSSGQNSMLSKEQVKVLEFLHVPLTSRGDDHWNRFYDLLKEYSNRHGHVLVPRLCEIPGLGDWVTDQRRQYKSWKQGQATQLSKERREKLEKLGFAWQVRNRPEWDHRFQQLMEYKEERGDCKVPQHYKENKALGKWVAKQREQYKLLKKGQHSFLTPYRLEKLNQAGFVWQIRTALDTDEDNNAEDNKGVAADASSKGGGEDTPAGGNEEKAPEGTSNVDPVAKRAGEDENKAAAEGEGQQEPKKEGAATSPKKDTVTEQASV